MENLLLAPEQQNDAKMIPQPVPLLAGIILLAAAAHFTVLPRPEFGFATNVGGAFVILLSLALIGWCLRHFPYTKDPLRPFGSSPTLVTTGVYRVSRNPIYLGLAGILLGVTIVFSGSWLFLLALVAYVAALQFSVVMPEEAYLEAVFGDEYRQYKALVHQWL